MRVASGGHGAGPPRVVVVVPRALRPEPVLAPDGRVPAPPGPEDRRAAAPRSGCPRGLGRLQAASAVSETNRGTKTGHRERARRTLATTWVLAGPGEQP